MKLSLPTLSLLLLCAIWQPLQLKAATAQVGSCTPPTISCSADNFGLPDGWNPIVPTAATNFNIVGAPTPNPSLPTVADGCEPLSLTSNDVMVDNGCSRTITRTYTITDDNGDFDTCSQTYTFNYDVAAPMAICRDTVLYLDVNGSTSVDVAVLLSATDNCNFISAVARDTSFDCTAASSTFDFEQIVVDSAGNADTCSTAVMVLDTISPIVSCVDSTIFLDANGEADYTELELFEATDNCQVDFGPFDQAFIIDCEDLGNMQIPFVVLDINGNSSSCTASLAIQDTIAPVTICRDTVLYLDVNGSTSVDVAVLLSATDNCDLLLPAARDTVFDCTAVSLTFDFEQIVTDFSGNTDTCHTSVMVLDTISPIVNCVDTTIYLNANGEADYAELELFDATDNCQVDFAPFDQAFILGCDDTGMIQIPFTVSDIYGNSSFCTSNLTVLDTIAPAISCIDTILYLDANGEADYTELELFNAMDNCQVDFSPFDQAFIVDCDDLGATQIPFVVFDIEGNSNFCMASLTVLDTIAPVASCRDTVLYLNGNGEIGITVTSLVSGTDNCEVVLPTALDTIFDCTAADQIHTFEQIITDPSGNADSCVTTVEILDTIKPVLLVVDQVITLNNQGSTSIASSIIVGSVTDNCAPVDVGFSRPLIFECEDIGIQEVEVTATDPSGNETTEIATVEVLFDQPVLGCISEINITLNADCQATIIPSMVLAGNLTCLDLINLEIVVMDDDPSNGPIVDGCGSFQYIITEIEEEGALFTLDNFDNCWGTIHAEDKTSPELASELVAPAPLYCDAIDGINVNLLPFNISRCWIQSGADGTTINGSLAPALRARLLAGGGIPNFTDGCSNVQICVNDIVVTGSDCNDVVLTRSFIATDGINCTSATGDDNDPAVASYEIIFTRPSIEQVDAVNPTAIFQCDESFPTLAPNQFGDENPVPVNSDWPFFDDGSGPIYLSTIFCNVGATFQDGPRLQTCDQSYHFVRTFTVVDWCTPNQIETFTQLVKVGDFEAPVIAEPIQDLDFDGQADEGPLFFSTSNPDCSANFIIPPGGATDNCDPNPAVITYIFPGGDVLGLPIGPFAVNSAAFGIPSGDHVLRYIAQDACGNADTLDVDLTIGDKSAPIAICEGGLDISLGGAGVAQLCGEDIDQASYDDCSELIYQIAFLNADNQPIPGTGGWQECITLDCDMIGVVRVGLRVEDAAGNWNSCWLDVVVQDELPPLCVAPAPITTTCNSEDITSLPQNLEDAMAADPEATIAQLDALFGMGNGLDNCPSITVNQSVLDTRNSCGVGSIIRSFLITDGVGLTSSGSCTQLITVLALHDYTIIFPADTGSDECVEPDYNGVEFEERGCDLITTTADIDTFAATADECYKLRLTYEVINWCEYNTEEDPYTVPRDADGDDELEEVTWLHILPGDESTLADDIAYLDADGNRFNGFISPLDQHDPNGMVFGSSTEPYGSDEARGGFLYIQFIKVYDDVAPEVAAVTPEPFEDEDGDCEESVELGFTVSDECTSATDFTATAELDQFFQDVDGDEVLSLADFVPTGAPNLQPNVINNFDGTFTINFNVDLPLGVHAVRISASDGCGNTEVTLLVFEIIDTKAPTPVCINGLTSTLMPDGDGGGMAEIWASEFIPSESTDCNGPVAYSIYRSATAADANFPGPMVGDTGIFMTCEDEGLLPVRIYAIDAVGNSDYCETTLLVQAFQESVCDGIGTGNIQGNILSSGGSPVPNVEVTISDNDAMNNTINTDGAGNYSFLDLPLLEDYTIAPSLIADVNVASTVTTYDILLINRHILAIAEFSNPYQHLVADVNLDGMINVLDVVHIRMVIVGFANNYPIGPSWRFANADFEFDADPSSWVTANFSEVYNVNDLPGDILGADFVALEMGNVSEGELDPAQGEGEARSAAKLVTSDIELVAGNTYQVPFFATGLYGFQGTLELGAAVELMDIDYGQLSPRNMNLDRIREGLMTMSYDDATASLADFGSSSEPAASSNSQDDLESASELLFTLHLRATADVQLSDVVNMTSRVATAEAYPVNGGIANLGLRFESTGGLESAGDLGFSLEQNSPNPFRTNTQIVFELPIAGTAKLIVQDAIGRAILVREIEAQVGYNQLTINSEDLNGAKGILTYTLSSNDRTASRRMIVE